MAGRVTAKQVAEAAGVSRSAVSLVLNGRGDGFLAKETQERIREVADALGYRPNLLAQGLRNQRSKVIGIMSDEAVASPFDGAIIAGADAVARAAGYMTLAADTQGDPAKGEDVARLLLDRAVEGLLFLTVGVHETHVVDSMLRVPSALANCFPSEASPAGADLLPVFLPDDEGGGREAAAYLISLGHRRIGLLRGEMDTPASSNREVGYRKAMAAAGLPVRESWVEQGGFQIEPGYAAASRVLSLPEAERPTALLAANDRAAIGAILAAAHRGLSVPADLSVMGYDNESRLADSMVPSLSTVALPLRELGSRAMAAVLDRLEVGGAPAPAARVLLPPKLIIRDSTMPPPVG